MQRSRIVVLGTRLSTNCLWQAQLYAKVTDCRAGNSPQHQLPLAGTATCKGHGLSCWELASAPTAFGRHSHMQRSRIVVLGTRLSTNCLWQAQSHAKVTDC